MSGKRFWARVIVTTAEILREIGRPQLSCEGLVVILAELGSAADDLIASKIADVVLQIAAIAHGHL